ncbi:MAG: hypothetical protein LBC59_10080 [Chitinispirillales bacterium]|jgi:uncharacterized protein (TIGR02145 family)|nr:hypothetical protein [Chitinispirillales bacterium]
MRIENLITVIATIGTFCLSNATEPPGTSASGTFTDTRNGKKYKTTVIGGRTWMAENLNYLTGNSWCYENKSANCNKYGRLYDWKTANKACPAGYHLPSNEEWEDLGQAMLGYGYWYHAGGLLKAKNGWNVYKNVIFPHYEDSNGNGTDDYGFSALPGGLRDPDDGSFRNSGEDGFWWTATLDSTGNAHLIILTNSGPSMKISRNVTDGNRDGYSVRCVQEESFEKDDIFDSRDGRKYRTVKIGGKRWMAENLNYKPESGKYRSIYSDNNFYGKKYGKLYDWHTARTICPVGYHLPCREEWNSLLNAAGGKETAGKKLKARSGWDRYIVDKNDGNGTDDYGFSALPGGGFDKHFYGYGSRGLWWAVTECGDSTTAYYIDIDSNYDEVMEGKPINMSDDALSVRCVQD